jgi:hypothetical protein
MRPCGREALDESDGEEDEEQRTASIKLAVMMLSSTARKTILSCSVSVAHVKWT